MAEIDVYKFGGAAVKDAAGVKNVTSIINQSENKNLLIVVSAMGSITNKLEELNKAYIGGNAAFADQLLQEIKQFHFDIAHQLFENNKDSVFNEIANVFVEVEWILEEDPQDEPGYIYDQIVSIGEILSTKIVAAYLQRSGTAITWVDARNYLKSDNNYQEANIDWQQTTTEINGELRKLLNDGPVITQGFIASSSENFTTTLGRDGSDYSAAIFCACLDANSLTIWKDVPGVLNADPKWFDETAQIPELSYHDAIELSYYGATVIHPKTIKPLQNKNIPLYVRSFLEPKRIGTKISGSFSPLPVPSFIFKVNQVLISIFPKDFSFIIEENLSNIFSIFHKHKVKVNTMLNSALSFSVSVDNDTTKIAELIEELSISFKVKYNKDVELVTIRYYNQETIERISRGKKVLLEVKSRYTCQMVMKENSDFEQ